MAYTNIDKPSDYFNTVLYTGTGTTQNVTGVGFNPDFVWVKSRSNAYNHTVWDRVRGAGQRLIPNLTEAEETQTGDMSAFITDGITVNGGNTTSGNGFTYAMWNWLAGGTAVSNTQGSITSSVSANTTSGFSIVSYTGNGSPAQTVGHGLGVAPKMVIVKNRGSVYDWRVYHQSINATNYLVLNTNGAYGTATSIWNDTQPTSNVFSIGDSPRVNESGIGFIAYCFAEKKGFSKFGSYVGNGGNQFIYTGFKPAFVIEKRSSNISEWDLYDNKRNTFNSVTKVLKPNTSDAEATYGGLNFLSNGFEAKGSLNDSGQTLIYMAFAESPFTTSTGIPTTAR